MRVLNALSTPSGMDRGRLGEYVAGCGLFSTGAYFFITSDLGTDPLDTFALGVLRHLPLTIGLVQTAVAVVCVGIAAALSSQRPRLSPIFTFLFCGTLIDLQRRIGWLDGLHVARTAMLVMGTVLCAYGSALIIMSGFGVRAIDLLAIEITRRWRWPFWSGKGLIEISLLTCGYLLGGPCGSGTICFLVGVDLLIQPMIFTSSSLFGWANWGLPRVASEPE